MNTKLNILITTGIFPPKIGGPAQYAKNLALAFQNQGHRVEVKTFNLEDRLPTGLRHLFFLFKILPSVWRADAVFILDTFSVGLPTVLACRIFGKVGIIRTGGDFLWEQYVERTKKKVLLREFYQKEMPFFSAKEKMIFKLIKWTLQNAACVIFSTDWQRDIFTKPYQLVIAKTALVENYYGPKESDDSFATKTFVASARNLTWKNFDLLEQVFVELREVYPDLELFTQNLPYRDFMQKMKNAYAVILVSLGDISPNMILDAIRLNRPFICTREVGIYERIKTAGTFVDPLDKEAIKTAVREIMTKEGYDQAKDRVRQFDFTHTWPEIAEDFLRVFASFKI